ncbi:AAA family ATPase [Paenibacillus thermotolerans]|uniref:AAA family ATPase n=1 Tax=Paenibacillus thermotolerans TaxID=3027807 RepID=UPI0023675C2D|nr:MULTISPECIES: AAA family ATPase [unclassified Paenibacillus]
MTNRVSLKETSNIERSRKIQVVLRNQETAPVHAPQPTPAVHPKTLLLQSPFGDIFRELDNMIGLDNVKELVYEIYALLQVSQYRADAGLQTKAHVYHMIFKGNPGTGKTTVARIIAKLFHRMGVLTKGHFIEVERADLVGEYIGHTALKTRELVKKALGGILFIDEAYSLARGGEKDFGKEAIDALVKAMEDHREDFVLILAGYSDEMEQFLELNPGLPSRFPIQIDFGDYTIDELLMIGELMSKERDYVLLPSTTQKMKQLLMEEKAVFWRSFSNARFVRNMLDKAIRNQSVRLLHQYPTVPSKQELMTLRPEDIRRQS